VKPYLDLVAEVLTRGELREDRTGTGTRSVFGTQTKYNLLGVFPLVTTKRVPFKSVVKELLWFLRGATNINDGLDTSIWDEWADENGELGRIYGAQWRCWEGIDQITNVINAIKTNPTSRRLIVSAWNVGELDQMALPPCHMMFQFYVSRGKRLDCHLYQRSADLALGVPFNIASYALLTYMVANECGLLPGVFTHSIGDAHIYLNHVEGLTEQLSRTPRSCPTLSLPEGKPVLDIVLDDVVLHKYNPHPAIKFEISV